MIEVIKRRAFEVALAAIVGAIVLAVGLGTYLAYGRDSAHVRTILTSARKQAQDLLAGTLFSDDLVRKMGELVDRRKREYDDVLKFIKTESAKRKPLVPNLFPKSTELEPRQAFKTGYDLELGRLMDALKAVKPTLVKVFASANAPERTVISDESRKALMFADPKRSFARPEWADKGEAPGLEDVRRAQEDIWLMQDLVAIIAQMNREILEEIVKQDKTAVRAVGWAPIKELIEIRIGADVAVLAGTKMTPGTGRYRPLAPSQQKAGAPRFQAGMGAASWDQAGMAGFYQVLPFRLGVVADARYYGELVRRLKDKETFITVKAWSAQPIVTEAQLARNRDLLATELDDYGRKEGDPPRVKRDALVRLVVVGESLAWTLDGGRVTAVQAGMGAGMGAAPAAATPTKTGEAVAAPATPTKTN